MQCLIPVCSVFLQRVHAYLQTTAELSVKCSETKAQGEGTKRPEWRNEMKDEVDFSKLLHSKINWHDY